MKKIIFIVLASLCSCTKMSNRINYLPESSTIDTANTATNVEKKYYATIDTAEFIPYWNKFQKAILEHDTTALSLMINDSIINGWFLFKDYNNPEKLPKPLFLKNLYVLFSSEFLSLLKSYKIETYLESNRENILWKVKEKKTYRSYVKFYYTQTESGNDYYQIVEYQMSCAREKTESNDYVTLLNTDIDKRDYLFIEHDLGCFDYIVFHMVFVKSAIGIKLYSIDFSYNYSISD